MEAFTPAERRGALLVALLLALGAAHDLWRASHPLPAPGSRDLASVGVAGEDGGRTARLAGQGPTPDTTRELSPGAGSAAPAIDLNRASARELDALPGVGPVLAARIVAYREREGRFRHREELMAVRGIGPKLYARLAPRIAVKGEEQSAAPPPGRHPER